MAPPLIFLAKPFHIILHPFFGPIDWSAWKGFGDILYPDCTIVRLSWTRQMIELRFERYSGAFCTASHLYLSNQIGLDVGLLIMGEGKT